MYHINRFITIALLGLLLAGCGSVKKLEIFSTAVERQPLDLALPTPLQLEQIRWIIITSSNAEEVFKKLEAEGIDPVLYGLTDKDYEIIAKNFAQIRAKLKESNEILDKYKQYYEADLQPKKEAEKK